MKSETGWTLLELLVVVAIAGTMILVTVPSLATINRARAVRAASSELRGILNEARFRAVSESRHIGLRFVETPDGWAFETYHDGDGDGLRNADIKKGVDKKLSGPRQLLMNSSTISIGMPLFPLRHPDSGKLMPPEGSPVRFGNSRICSFSPFGSSSSGSIYLTDGTVTAAAVRVYGATAKVRSIRYDRRSQTWR